jgi:four helix bundle protein
MKIYTVWLTVVANVYRLARHVERHDKDLARQMRRACSSAALNMCEGMHGRAGNRIARFHDSMGSACETRACLDVCVAATYVVHAAIDADLPR